MSRIDKCFTEVEQTLRKAGMEPEVLDEVRGTFQKIRRNTHLSSDEQIKRMHAASQEWRKRVFEERITKVKAEEKLQEMNEWLGRIDDVNERAIAFRNFLEQDASYKPTARQSVSKKIEGLTSLYLHGQLKPVWDALATQGLSIRETPLALDVHRQMRGIDTGNRQAVELTKEIRKVTEDFLTRLENSGVYVGRIKDWAPQSHSPSRIESNLDDWYRFMRENLDTEFHPDPEASAEAIRSSLITRDLVNDTRKSISQSRKVNFKTPEAEFEYFNRFGEGSFVEILSNNIRNLIRDTVISEDIGPRPRQILEGITQDLQKQVRRQPSEKKPFWRRSKSKEAAAALERTQRVGQSITGELYNPVNQNIANWSSAGRNWMVTQFLGLVPLAMASQDSMISLLSARFHTGGFGSGITQQMKALVDVVGNKHAKAYAENLGVWTHAMQMATMQRYYNQMGGGTEGLTVRTGGRKFSQFETSEKVKNFSQMAATNLTRLSGAQMIERALRSATTLMQSRALAKWADVNYNDLPGAYKRVLGNSGIDQKKWGRLQRNLKTDPMTKAVDFDVLPRDLKEELAVFLRREADLAVVYPSHYSRSSLIFGARAGTPAGEVSAAFTQFWSWPLEMFRGPLMREAAMGKGGLAMFSGAMFAGGLFTQQLYALAKGEPMHNWDDPHFLVRGLGRSGILSPIGDAALQAALWKHVDVPAGPSMTVPARFLQMMGEQVRREAEAHTQRNLGPVVRSLREVTVPNLWWMEYGLTHRAMDSMMWQVDPQYMINRERRFARERQ